jgi:hypothetical protein
MLKNRKLFLLLQMSVMLFCLLGLSVSVQAQKKPAVKKPVPKATPKPAASFAVKEEGEKVSIQIKNLTRFIYVLGGVAKTIEDIDKDSRASASVRNQNNAAKQTVLQSIKNVRAGVVQLENDFHAKLELRPYLPYIQGISETAGLAEDQAVRGQLNNAGKTLLEVINKLTDTLQNLR